MALSDICALETRKLWVPFPNYELSAKVLSDFQLIRSMEAIGRMLDPEFKIKRWQAHDRMWRENWTELGLYYWYMLKEYKGRELVPRFVELPWTSPRNPPWWDNKLFFISQKVNLLRQNMKWYMKYFYVLSHRQWPSGTYYPFPHVNNIQREINAAWEDVWEHEFSKSLKKVGVLLAKGENLNIINPKEFHGVEDKIWKKKQRQRRAREARRKRRL